jgi:hypothetical protein
VKFTTCFCCPPGPALDVDRAWIYVWRCGVVGGFGFTVRKVQ